ncbi:hypothetical protein HDE_14408 [Halotydeus destructor]|nr:hypothetical protein HDE_14408 [Halotydeus destructor]
MSFYVYLPSNVQNEVFENTLAHFLTPLPKTIELDETYEVALSEISYTNSWYSFDEDEVITLAGTLGVDREIRVPARGYANIGVLVDTIDGMVRLTLQRDGGDELTEPCLVYDSKINKVSTTEVLTRLGYHLDMSIRLRNILGLPHPTDTSINVVNDHPDLSFGRRLIFVYSDIVKHSVVGDSYSQLLRVVPVNFDAKPNDQVVKVLPYLGQQAYKTGTDIMDNLREGNTFGEAAKKSLKRRAAAITEDALGKVRDYQEGRGQTNHPKRQNRLLILIMSAIHEKSSIAALPEFDIFAVPPTQITVLGTKQQEFRPLSVLRPSAPIEFSIQTSPNEYIALNETYMSLGIRVKLSKGLTNASMAEYGAKLLPCQYLLHSLFKSVEVTIGNKRISMSPQNYAYRSFLEGLLGYSEKAKKTHLSVAGWAGSDENLRLMLKPTSEEQAKTGRLVELMGLLHLDLTFQNRVILGGTTINIKLVPNEPHFYLKVEDGYKAEALDQNNTTPYLDISYKDFKSSKAIFAFHLSPDLSQDINRAMGKNPWFKGAFPCDYTPTINVRPASIILNTDPKGEPGEHWVAIVLLENARGEYFDSFGFPPVVDCVREYLEPNAPAGYIFNSVPLQHPLASSCGNHCISFLRLRSLGCSLSDYVSSFTPTADRNESLVETINHEFTAETRDPYFRHIFY